MRHDTAFIKIGDRNSKVGDMVNGLRSAGLSVQVHDPLADPGEVKHEYGIELVKLETLRPFESFFVRSWTGG